MKVIYTDAASRELREFQSRQKTLIERLVSDRKVIFGDDVLEITASDIKDAEQRIQAIRPSNRRYQSSLLVTRVYVVVGLGMMVGAFFYPQIQNIFEHNRVQALVFAMGGTIAAMGVVFGYVFRQRRQRFEEQLFKLQLLESSQFAAERAGSEEARLKLQETLRQQNSLEH